MEPLKGVRLFLLAIAISFAAFIVSLDGLIVNVAIPTISGELGVRLEVGVWTITLFTMASTLCVLLSGWLTDRFGKVPLFVTAISLFSFFSVLCGLTHNFEALLICRVLQGASAGIITPLSLVLIIQSFPQEKRSVAVGFWGFFVMVGPAMGPMIGGWLSDYHWPWMFYINVPFGIFSAVTILWILKDLKEEKKVRPLDKMGVTLLFSSIAFLQVALNRGNIDDWFRSPFITTLLILAGIGFVFFIIWELFHPEPFVDFAYFKSRNFTLAALSTGAAMALIFSSFVLDSLWVQQVLGYTPAWAGYTLTPVGIFPLLIYPLMGLIVGYLDLRLWIGGSFLLYAATFFSLSDINLDVSFAKIAFPRLIQGIGFAMFTIPNSLIAIQGIAQDKLTFVISLFSFMRMLFVGFGVPLSTNLWDHRQRFYQSRTVEQTFAGNPTFEAFVAPLEQVANSPLQADALAAQTIAANASTLGLADIYYVFAWAFIALSLVVIFYKIPKKEAKVA